MYTYTWIDRMAHGAWPKLWIADREHMKAASTVHACGILYEALSVIDCN